MASAVMKMTTQGAAPGALAPGEEMPPTLEVLRKYDEVEYRRRSMTFQDPPISSVHSRKISTFDRVRHPGVNRLLRLQSSGSGGTALETIVDANIEVDEDEWSCASRTKWTEIVLKMSAFSDDDVITSFRFGPQGGGLGRDACNVASIPADKLLSNVDHAQIQNLLGRFYIVNGSETNSGTYVRLLPCLCVDADVGNEEEKMQWPLDVNVVFRAGKSDFRVVKFDEATQTMELSALSGKLAGSVFTIGPNGAGIGRSADNLIHMGDGELSRKHCAIWFDDLTSRFYLIDLNSTNGTFMKLVGPYNEPYRLEIGDDLLISQTCLSVSRFDYGAHASMGARKQMEDAHTILQDLGIESLSRLGLHPQTFFGVFDGHGGDEASAYVSEELHLSISNEFRLHRKSFDEDLELTNEQTYQRIEERLIHAFEKTDEDFLSQAERPQAGSTGTTVFIAGNQIFAANVGDSRTVMSRKGVAERLSNDHKPSRPDEAQRIRETGGFVIRGRIMGELAVSRAFGDSPFKTFDMSEDPKSEATSAVKSEFDSQPLPVNPNEILKGPLVIATPEITRTELTDEVEFILLASDGLYDVLKDQEAVDFLRRRIAELGDVQRATEALVEHAIVQQRSMDNVTAVVILFVEPFALAGKV